MSMFPRITQFFHTFGLKPFLVDTRPHTHIQWLTLASVLHNVILQAMYVCLHLFELSISSGMLIFSNSSVRSFVNVIYMIGNRRGLQNYLIKLEVASKFRAMPAQKRLFGAADSKFKRRLVPSLLFMVLALIYVLVAAGLQVYHFLAGTATEGTYKLPFYMQYFFSFSARGVHQFFFITTTLSFTVSMINDLVVDYLFYSFCYQIEALYLCLGQDFQEIDNMFGYSSMSAVRERLVDQKMQLLMYQHGQYIEIIKMGEEFFQPILQLKFVTISLNLALVVYQANQASLDKFILPLVNGFFATLQIYFYCSVGNCVSDVSDGFSTVVYNGHWYDYPMWAKRYVCMIGDMSRKTRFRVCSTINCDMFLFSLILQFSYSGYSFLKSLK